MNWRILGYKFQIERSSNNGDDITEMDSLKSALKNISLGDLLRAKYSLQIGEQTELNHFIQLEYQEITGLNEEEIISLLDKKVQVKHLGNYTN